MEALITLEIIQKEIGMLLGKYHIPLHELQFKFAMGCFESQWFDMKSLEWNLDKFSNTYIKPALQKRRLHENSRAL